MVSEQLDELIKNNLYLKDSKGNTYYNISHNWHEVKAFWVEDKSIFPSPITLHGKIYDTLCPLTFNDYTYYSGFKQYFMLMDKVHSDIMNITYHTIFELPVGYFSIRDVGINKYKYLDDFIVVMDLYSGIRRCHRPIVTPELYEKYRDELYNM